MRGIGPHEYHQMEDFKEKLAELGFEVDLSPFGNDNRFQLKPKDDDWPAYTRDATIYVGDMDEILAFLNGIRMLRDYDMYSLRLYTQKRREKKEQDIRNQHLIDELKKDRSSD